ncbi:MAG TPA: aminopeptidase P N-terminal domain-containing protein [Anaerolineales bacterium]|nr:aminopeptidase P N-terminal domain-containing protein [Anaerolineales bacterium]
MDKKFHSENRRRVAAHMTGNDAMLFFSGESVRKTADENFPFFTNRNFLYLTGIQQEQSTLLLLKKNDLISECLFVTKPDFEREIWTGRRLTDEEINEISGVEGVEDIKDLSRRLDELLSSQPAMTLWLCFDALAPERAFDLEREFAQHIQTRHPHVVIRNSYPLLARMRKLKAPEEIEAIRKAMQITEAGIRRTMRVAKPGMMEYELEAEFNSELAAHGQRRTAFPSILAGGERIFYLHYADPMSVLADGELILSDVGSTYDEYCTDISRVFPANGHFSERQAQIYQIAYDANRAVMAQVRPGIYFPQLNRTCRDFAFEGLKALGLLDDFADIRRYVWHGAIHHVGLDTHDVGGYEEPMAENMVFTVDAGIYVREWGIGLRIEDNVLVTADGCENLSAAIPVTIEEIESIMALAGKHE